MTTNKLYSECPTCLVDLSPDDTINKMQTLLIRAAEGLDDSLSPRIDHEETDQWWKERKALIAEIQEVIGYAGEH